MGTARFSETSLIIYESTLRRGPEDFDLFQKVQELSLVFFLNNL
jgi:hypothetical protein